MRDMQVELSAPEVSFSMISEACGHLAWAGKMSSGENEAVREQEKAVEMSSVMDEMIGLSGVVP